MVLRYFLWRILGVVLWTMGVYAQTNVNQDGTKPYDDVMNKVERTFLSALGLKERPRIDAASVTVPPYMLHLYNLQVSRNLQEKYEENTNIISELDANLLANTVRSYVHKEGEYDSLTPARSMFLQFNVSEIPENEIIRAVELRISHVARSSSADQYPFMVVNSNRSDKKLTKKDLKFMQRLRIYDILRPSRDENESIHRLLDTNIVDTRTSSTIKFDVAPAVKRWLNKPKRNYGLYLEVTPLKKKIAQKENLRIRLIRSAKVNDASYVQQQPLLLIHSDDGTTKSRKKRNSKTSYKRYVQHCQRHSLRVDFRKVEWTNWIVAPPGYDAFYCQGECHFPLADHMNSTNHAVIQTLVHSRYPSRVPSACCVPTMHTAISMLYVDEDEHVVLKNYQDMVVEACGCR